MLSRANALTLYLSLWNSRDASASRHCAWSVNADLWRYAQHDKPYNAMKSHSRGRLCHTSVAAFLHIKAVMRFCENALTPYLSP